MKIRFRAWNKVGKKMFTGLPFSKAGLDDFLQVLKHPQIYEVMQYIGFKDNNKVHIYEGDIIEFEDMGEDEYGEGYDIVNRAVVTFKDGRFTLEKFSITNSGIYENIDNHDEIVFAFSHATVIGNIFEQPQLVGM